MLIQAYCQQEREKRCTITANTKSVESKDKEESSADTDTAESMDCTDGTKTPKPEPDASPTSNDVEMVEATEPVTTIKQEPEDEVTSVEMNASADDSSDKRDDANKSDNQIANIKNETEENSNDNNTVTESNNDDASNSTNEPIKIEEATNDKDDPYSKDINIDPRTYCKLGHFHLLLEDYSKGINWDRIHFRVRVYKSKLT